MHLGTYAALTRDNVPPIPISREVAGTISIMYHHPLIGRLARLVLSVVADTTVIYKDIAVQLFQCTPRRLGHAIYSNGIVVMYHEGIGLFQYETQ